MVVTHNQRLIGSLTSLAFLLLLGCSRPTTSQREEVNSSGSQSATAGEVNVYSARHYDTDDALYKAFTAEKGINVNLIEGKNDELLERIKSEGTNTRADVLITVDAGRLWRAEQENLLQPVSTEGLETKIPESLRHPEGLWFGLTKRARIMVYNKANVSEIDLSTYEALAEPEWQGRVCIRSSNNIYNQSLLASMVASLGAEKTEAWAQGLVNNLARDPSGGDVDQIKAVAAGQCDVAIVNHYYVARLATSDNAKNKAVIEQVGVFFPNQGDRGTHVNISGAGVVANAPNPDNAIKFLEYLVTPDAQKVLGQDNNEYPVVVGVTTTPILESYGNFKADSVNVSALGRNNPEAIKIADRVGWK